MIATLSWGIRSAFPNLNLGNFGEIFNVFSSCTGGKGEGGGLLGGSDSGNNFEGTLLGKEGYERAIDDAATLEILTEMGVADKMTGVDHTLAFGTYQIAANGVAQSIWSLAAMICPSESISRTVMDPSITFCMCRMPSARLSRSLMSAATSSVQLTLPELMAMN